MLRLGFAVCALVITSTLATADSLQYLVVPSETEKPVVNSEWSDKQAGVMVATNSDENMAALKKIYGAGLDRIRVREFDKTKVYFYVFAGQRTRGSAHSIEGIEVRNSPDTFTLVCNVIETPAGQNAIAQVTSPWVLVKINRKDLVPNALTDKTKFKIVAQRFQRLGVDDRPATK
jgi:hypothetical protein